MKCSKKIKGMKLLKKRSFFSVKFKKNRDKQIAFNEQNQDELKSLTDKLTSKSKEELYLQYKEYIAHYSASDSPLSKGDAERILKALIGSAVSNRKLLGSYIERSISDGEIYDRYYKKMVHMNDLVNETYVKLKYMQNIQERFEYKKKIYNSITGNMYLDQYISVSDSHQTPVSIDIGDEIDKAGGVMDEETSNL